MKINDVVNSLDLEIICNGDADNEVGYVITGDLMSFIVGMAKPGSVWVTVQNHLNAAAVAVLKDIPLIIISSGRSVPSDLRQRCGIEGITLATSGDSSFRLCSKLAELGLKG